MKTTNLQSKSPVLEQVKKICCSKEFESKALLCSFLHFVVEKTLAGQGDQLKGYTIGVEVMGKDSDFDPEQDSLVRIHAGRLRRSLKVYYLEEGKDDPIHIEIPKGAYRPEFKNAHTESNSVGPAPALQGEMPLQPVLAPTVAVLPFRNLTGNREKDYFALGVSEEISLELTKYEDIRVMSCWRRPESEPDDTQKLYEKLGARFLVDGSVQMNAKHIKVNVKLLDTITGKHLWAERYTREFSAQHFIEVEEDIANVVARVIGSETGIVLQQLAQESNRLIPQRFEIIDAILKFYYYEANLSPELTIDTYQAIHEAWCKKPDSGLLNAMLASLMGNAYALDFPDNSGAYEKMAELAETALNLDPRSQIVRVIYTYKCFIHDEKDRFYKEAEHCLSLNLPSPMRLGSLGFHISLYGDWERGKAILDRAMNQSRGYPLFFHGATTLYFYRTGNYEQALREAQHYDMPTVFWAPMLRAAVLGQLGRKEEAGINIDHLKQLKPEFERKARYLITRFVKEDALVGHLLEGLRKSGMAV